MRVGGWKALLPWGRETSASTRMRLTTTNQKSQSHKLQRKWAELTLLLEVRGMASLGKECYPAGGSPEGASQWLRTAPDLGDGFRNICHVLYLGPLFLIYNPFFSSEWGKWEAAKVCARFPAWLSPQLSHTSFSLTTELLPAPAQEASGHRQQRALGRMLFLLRD